MTMSALPTASVGDPTPRPSSPIVPLPSGRSPPRPSSSASFSPSSSSSSSSSSYPLVRHGHDPSTSLDPDHRISPDPESFLSSDETHRQAPPAVTSDNVNTSIYNHHNDYEAEHWRSEHSNQALLAGHIPGDSRHDPPNPPDLGSTAQPVTTTIEMDAITQSGHRRRRSSLINPASAATAAAANHLGRARSRSIRRCSPDGGASGSSSAADAKILEETGEEQPIMVESLRVGGAAGGGGGRGGGGGGGGGDISSRNHSDEDGLSDEDLHDDEETGLTDRERRRKRLKRLRNQQLDQRVAREHITREEKKEADLSVLKNLLINVLLIGLWYTFSLLISLYNKWMFSPDNLNFPFPMFTTATHMLVQFSLASLVLYLFPSFRPQHPRSDPSQPVMTKTFYLTRIGPCGLATGLDIGLGNASLQFITLTFYTMCKSSSLAFVLLFAFLFRLETPNWKLVTIIAIMTVGVVMMVAGEVEFKLGGFVLVISAAFFSGFRWALTQILLLRNPATSNPFSSIFFLAPVMFLTLICIAIPVEGAGNLIAGLGQIAEQKGALVAPLLLLFPGVIAFLMTSSEFALLKRTSVVTLSIAGIFKEAVTIAAAAIVFGDTMTLINMVGLITTLVAIGWYNYIKISRMRLEAQLDVHSEHLAAQHAAVERARRSDSLSPSPVGGRGEVEVGENVGLLAAAGAHHRRSMDDDDAPVGAANALNQGSGERVLFTGDGGDVVIAASPSHEVKGTPQ